MKPFHFNLSRKITMVIMLTTVMALFIACSMIFVYGLRNIRRVMTHKHSVLATTIGTNCTAALAFHDQEAARRVLSAVSADRHIKMARVYDGNRQIFAEYQRSGLAGGVAFDTSKMKEAHTDQYFTNDALITFREIVLDNDPIGTILLISDLDRMNKLVKNNLYTMAATMIVASLIVFFISLRLQRVISKPIIKLKEATTRISQGELDTKLAIKSNDEIGELVSSFNEMALRLQISRDELIEAKNRAEESERVTKDALVKSEKLRKAEEEALKAQQALMESEKQRAAAEEAARTKSEFLANMSHELRTPLHGILSFAGFGLKKYSDLEPNKLHDYFQQIDRSGRILLALLNDLLDLSKLEAGKMNFHFEKEDLNAWVSVILDEFESLTLEKQLRIEYKPPDFNPVVWHDQRRIMQVVRNLLSNAIKFSNTGGKIVLKICKQNAMVQVSVRDHGVGVPETELQAIFDKFTQSSQTKTGAGGTGLGLSICREIIAAHKGRIWAANNADGGAIFTFELPVAQTETGTTDGVLAASRCLDA